MFDAAVLEHKYCLLLFKSRGESAVAESAGATAAAAHLAKPSNTGGHGFKRYYCSTALRVLARLTVSTVSAHLTLKAIAAV
jgi:hypothetical protein